MADPSADRPNPSRKRFAPDDGPVHDEQARTAKRVDAGSSHAGSTHLVLLEELCDLEGDDAESCLEPSVTGSCGQEDLVAEMMKSLEKVLEEGDQSIPCEPSDGLPVDSLVGALQIDNCFSDSTWAGNGSAASCGFEASGFDTKLHRREASTPDNDERIQFLLQASDDELGIPAPTTASDLDTNVSLQEEWLSIVDGGFGPTGMAGLSWLDVPLAHSEEARDMFEPIVLF